MTIPSAPDESRFEPDLYASALHALPAGVVLVGTDGRVRFYNTRGLALLNLPEAHLPGLAAADLYHALAAQTDQPEQAERDLSAGALALGAPVELRLSQSGGQVLSIEWFRIDRQGTGLVIRDITRDKEADAMKSQLLSTVSHEFRTPLASIKGFASTLLREDVDWDSATERDFLKIIEEETDRLSELIDNLLDMSQIEVGMLRIVPEPTQLRPIVREVTDAMRMRTEQHWFVVDLPAELPLVLADARRVRQVLRNLVENALKYSPRGGQITVSCHVAGDWVVVRVADQGQGIPPQFLGRIFERFFQVDGASTRKTGGSGLGLSIAKGIVDAHGGRIWAESAPGQGSVFSFTLPRARDEGAEV